MDLPSNRTESDEVEPVAQKGADRRRHARDFVEALARMRVRQRSMALDDIHKRGRRRP